VAAADGLPWLVEAGSPGLPGPTSSADEAKTKIAKAIYFVFVEVDMRTIVAFMENKCALVPGPIRRGPQEPNLRG